MKAFRMNPFTGQIDDLSEIFDSAKENAIEGYMREIISLRKKLDLIDDMMVTRIKSAKLSRESNQTETGKKRERYREHALSEALGEIRKISKLRL